MLSGFELRRDFHGNNGLEIQSPRVPCDGRGKPFVVYLYLRKLVRGVCSLAQWRYAAELRADSHRLGRRAVSGADPAGINAQQEISSRCQDVISVPKKWKDG